MLFQTMTLWEVKFADVTLCTAKPWAEHWPQLIQPSSQCCKKLLLVQQCRESPRHLLVGDTLCNLILEHHFGSKTNRLIAHPSGDPQSLQQHLALPRNTWHFQTGSAVQPHTRPRCWSSFWYYNLHGGSWSSDQTFVSLTSSPGKVC